MFPHLPKLHDIRRDEAGSASCSLHVPVDHPSVEGHFPDFPIIPGAVLLGWVWAVAAALEMTPQPTVRSAKYLQPVMPGDWIEIHFSKQTRGMQARIRKADKLAAQFQLLYAEQPTS
jgi:3-hydroxyacyl-[acyl-carrier-protein] dehydratase